MAININVQYNGGRLLDIILLTQCYYHHINAMLDVLLLHCFCFVFAFCLVSLHGD